MDDQTKAKIQQAIALEVEKGRTDEQILQLAQQAGLDATVVAEELKAFRNQKGPKRFIKPALITLIATGAIGGGVWFANAYLIESLHDDELIDPIVAKEQPSEDDNEIPKDEPNPDKIVDPAVTDTPIPEVKDGSPAAPGTADTPGTLPESDLTDEPIAPGGEPVEPNADEEVVTPPEQTPDDNEGLEPSELQKPEAVEFFVGLAEIFPLPGAGQFSVSFQESGILIANPQQDALLFTPIKEGETVLNIVHRRTGQKLSYPIKVLPEQGSRRTRELSLTIGEREIINDFSDADIELTTRNSNVISVEKGRDNLVIITANEQGVTNFSVAEPEKQRTTVYVVEVE
jgi:hypothetical protein